VGGTPVFISRGYGSHIVDVDGNDYIDYLSSWGPLILGHANPIVVDSIIDTARKGTSYGAPTESEIELAELICGALPSVDKVRLVNSGTEATMSAVRLARAFTGKNKIVKFDGCYHGHSDAFLIKAGSGATTLGIPDSPGVPSSVVSDVISLPFNNIEIVEEVFNRTGDSIAAVIVEPVAGNMGVILPKDGFLEGLRRLTQMHGALLIFDEVITGFRLTFGGVQNITGIEPDITTLGKIIGGGLPVGAYGARDEIMNRVAPEGSVYQAGTLSGNPLAMKAGYVTLKYLKEYNPYPRLEELMNHLANGIREILAGAGIACRVNYTGSMMTPFFTDVDVVDYTSALTTDKDTYARLFHNLLEVGIYTPPSPFECWFVSAVHTENDVNSTLDGFSQAVGKL
jgi:glutamate-1-semialdehyde 2,1-aminomutase